MISQTLIRYAFDRGPKRYPGGVRETVCHRLNAMHVYCRLRDLGVGRQRALRIARRYEAILKVLKGG